jgi:DmsE family decaheme c-type cytochrome
MLPALSLLFICAAAGMQSRSDQGPQPNTQAATGSDSKQQRAKKNHKNVKDEDSLYEADPSQYVGADTCKTCHEQAAAGYERGPHWKTALAKHVGPQWQGCEACHGPGKAHAESADPEKIIRFNSFSREASSKRCLACHEYGEEHANFLRSAHLKNNVGCVDCHTIHTPRVQIALLKAAEPQLCYSCHLNVRPSFSLPYHHRVNEGLLTCTNCHNAHGGFLTHQLRSTASQDLLCFNCHTDKAGPFAFEHGPVKTEGCVACHFPHGSSNPRMLRRSQINLLCLECHTLTVDSAAPAIPSFHNQAQKYQACTLCHVAIHGSNTDHFFFRP